MGTRYVDGALNFLIAEAVRTTARLNRALSELRHLEGEILRFYRRSKLTDELIGLRPRRAHGAACGASRLGEQGQHGRGLPGVKPPSLGTDEFLRGKHLERHHHRAA